LSELVVNIKRIMLFVSDVERCAEFYQDVFGLEPIEDGYIENEWRELRAGDCNLAFHRALGPNGPVTEPTGSPNNPHKVVFFAGDVAGTREILASRGAEMDEVKVFGDVHMCDGSDPEGHRFQISNR